MDIPRLRTWYFAINRHGLLRAFDQVQVAVLSARKYTSLAPVCLIDAGGDTTDIAQKLDWLREQGVKLIPHQASFVPDLRARHGDKMDVFSGHWLRCDIPVLETVEQYVLYTDIDVMFMGPVEDNNIWPQFIACGPEHEQTNFTYFNSGVMVMNVPNLRPYLPELSQIALRQDDRAAAYNDQGAFNHLFRDRWDRLPPTWNWKPYWGRSDTARILHFHGPKPGLVRHLLAGGDRLNVPDGLITIFERNRDGYVYYNERFYAFLESPEAMKPG
jgi:hypothetical protein